MSKALAPAIRKSLSFRNWPVEDQSLWTAAMSATAAEQTSIAAHWSESTRTVIRSAYGRWLTWLGEQDPLTPSLSPAARHTPECLSRYIATLREDYEEITVANYVEHLGRALRVTVPEINWRWVNHEAAQIRSVERANWKKAALLLTPDSSAEERSADAVRERLWRLTDWPALDQALWAAAFQPRSLIDAGSVTSKWSEATREMTASGYGRWLRWLSEQDALDPLASPSVRVSLSRLWDWAEDLGKTLAPYTVGKQVQGLADALRAMAPEQDWRYLSRAAGRIRAGAVSVRDKRGRMQSPVDLVGAGKALMDQADDPTSGPPLMRAVKYRDGLMIALLAHRPMRVSNVASIICGQHLTRRGKGWWFKFPETETKTHRLLEFPNPEELDEALNRYLETYRPILLAQEERQATPATALWISKRGRNLTSFAIKGTVRSRTVAAFGKALGPHLFRTCAATEIAISVPDEVGLIRPVLGHATLATSERHYNLAGSVEAGRRYAETISGLRKHR